jgi:dUTP pyrophosphatase
MTVPRAHFSPAIIALQDLGYRGDLANDATSTSPPSPSMSTEFNQSASPTSATSITDFYIKSLSLHATIPVRATDGSVGYDLFSAMDTVILPMQRVKIPTDIALKPPPGTYAQIHSRSGLAATHCLDVKGGTIDPDYRGNIIILLHNYSDKTFTVSIGDRIAQMVFHSIATPLPILIEDLDSTIRGYGGFGSTGNKLSHATPTNPYTPQRPVTPDLFTEPTTATTRPLTETSFPPIDIPPKPPDPVNTSEVSLPFNIWVSNDPFDNLLTIPMAVCANILP